MVPRNRFYGIRTHKTLSSDFLWYESNNFGGTTITAAACTYITFAFYTVFSNGKQELLTMESVHMLFLLVPLTMPIIATFIHIKRL